MKGLIFALLIGLTTSILAGPTKLYSEEKASRKGQWILTSYNVRMFGARSLHKQTSEERVLEGILKDIRPDLLAVQEVVGDRRFRKFIAREFRGYKTILSKCGGTGKQKVGFVYNASKFELISMKEDDRLKDPSKGCNEGLRPAMIGKFREYATGFQFVAMSIHLKAGGHADSIQTRQKQYKRLTKIVNGYRKRGQKNLILMGDFNTTEYLARGRYYRSFVNFVDDNGLEDLSENLDCSSYWHGEDRNDNYFHASLLDHVLVSYGVKRKFKRSYTRAKAHCQKSSCRQQTPDSLGLSFTEVSDHCPVVTRLN